MKNSAFKYVSFGIIFILLDIPIMKIDILPDTVGYILFLFAFKALAKNSSSFVKGKKMSIIIIIFSIISMYLKIAISDKFNIPSFSIFEKLTMPFELVLVILEIYIIYLLFSGIKDMCEEKNDTELYAKTEHIWKLYICIIIGSAIAGVLVFLPIVALPLMIVLMIAFVVLFFKTVRLMKECENKLL